MSTMKENKALNDEHQELLDGLVGAPHETESWSTLISIARSDSRSNAQDRSEFSRSIAQQATASFSFRTERVRWGRIGLFSISALAVIAMVSIASPWLMDQPRSAPRIVATDGAMTNSNANDMVYYVAFNYNGPTEGTQVAPFTTLAEGVESSRAGSVLVLQGGYTTEAIRLSKAIRLEANNGPVQIGIAMDEVR